MACPTCDHTMEGIGYGFFHCPRCGTMRNGDGSLTVPALVERCREFAGNAITAAKVDRHEEWVLRQWHRLGIAESISTPENRR